jgi:hypothetical protein
MTDLVGLLAQAKDENLRLQNRYEKLELHNIELDAENAKLRAALVTAQEKPPK